jgi:flagellar motility protein MotE (MotC chaperone)
MLDPLTALSLAGTIVQFVDFSTKLVAKGYELHKSADGASIGNAELEVIAKDLQELNRRLQQLRPSHDTDGKTLTDSNVALRKLSQQCSDVAAELIDALDNLKVQGTSNRRWKSFRQALKGLMKKEEVDAFARRLENFRDELNLHILVSMRYGLLIGLVFHSVVVLWDWNVTDSSCVTGKLLICRR